MLKQLLCGFVLAGTLGAAAGHAASDAFSAQTIDAQGVRLTVTPMNLAPDAPTWSFEVTLETHVRDLRDEMTRATILVADGRQYAPLDWTGAPPGSHHRKGSLRFAPITPYPSSLALQIRLEGETVPRAFHWRLKGISNAK